MSERLPSRPEDWLPWRDISDPFDAGAAPLFPPVPRLTTPGEPSAPEMRLYVALKSCGCTWGPRWLANAESQVHPRLVTLLREQGCTVLEYPEDAPEPKWVRCAEHASGVGR